jgi:hypothetical protein
MTGDSRTLALLSISRSSLNHSPSQQQTGDSAGVVSKKINGSDLERILQEQLRSIREMTTNGNAEVPIIDPNEGLYDVILGSMSLLNVIVEKVNDSKLFHLRRRFANILGPDYAVALGYIDGREVVVAFGNDPPADEIISHFRTEEAKDLVHAPLSILTDFDKLTIVNDLNALMVTATPGRVFTPAGGRREDFYLKTCEELDFNSILGLRIEPGGKSLE